MTADQNDLAQQVMELQGQMAFQEDAIRALDDAMATQQQEILLLRRQIELLKQRQEEQTAADEAGGGGMDGNERPPHY
ncbi:MAG: SlyX protein [Halioglobus sp.]|jgi:SlyX protein